MLCLCVYSPMLCVCVSVTLILQHGALLKNIQRQKCFVLKGSSFISVDHIKIKYSVAMICGGSDNNFLLKF